MSGLSSANASFTTNAGGTTAINGGAVTTTGAQTYNAAVTLGANAVLASSGSGTITFNSTVDGAHTLQVNSTGNEVFNGLVGNGTALTSLQTDAAGTVGGQVVLNANASTASGTNGAVNASQVHFYDQTVFNVTSSSVTHPAVSTTAGQIYGPVILNQTVTLKDLSGSFTAAYIAANGYQLYFDVPPNLIDVTGFGSDETLKRLLGAILAVQEPVERKRQAPIQPGHRTELPPWMITLPMNSLEVPVE